MIRISIDDFKKLIMANITASDKKQNVQTDFLPLQGTDYVEFYVGNAKQAAHYYMSAFGFQPLAYAGPETGVKDRASYAVRQNKLTLVLTTPIRPNNEIADHIYKHGDGVKALHCVWMMLQVHGKKQQSVAQNLICNRNELKIRMVKW